MVLSPQTRVSGTGSEPPHTERLVREAKSRRETSIIARLAAVLVCGGVLLPGETAFAQNQEKSASHSTLRPQVGKHFSRATHDTGEGDAEAIAHETADALAGRIEQPVMPPTRSSFLARWETVKGASGYRLDVSTSPSFDSYVSSYRDLDVGNVPNFVVTGLKRGTTYYYRVRPYSSAGTGSSSEALSVMTAGSGAGHASRSNESRKGEVVRLVISQAGDMAEEFGNFTLGFDQPDKTHISFDGSYLRVWRKIRGEWLEDAYFARPNEPAEKTEQKSGS